MIQVKISVAYKLYKFIQIYIANQIQFNFPKVSFRVLIIVGISLVVPLRVGCTM